MRPVALLFDRISIPSGAIKSPMRPVALLFDRISIPSGAIKSDCFLRFRPTNVSFQFLLVRLKVPNPDLSDAIK